MLPPVVRHLDVEREAVDDSHRLGDRCAHKLVWGAHLAPAKPTLVERAAGADAVVVGGDEREGGGVFGHARSARLSNPDL